MKNFLLNCLVVLVLCIPSVSFAESESDWSLYLGGWSKHLTSNDYDYNENNKLFGVKYNDWVVATFENSFHDQTYMVGYDFNTNWKDLQFGIITGASYGYDPEDTITFSDLNYEGFMPVLLPYVAYTGYNVVPTVGLLGNAVIFTFEYRF